MKKYHFHCPDHPDHTMFGEGPSVPKSQKCNVVVDVICHTHGDVHFDPNDSAAVKKHVTDNMCNTEPIYCGKTMVGGEVT